MTLVRDILRVLFRFVLFWALDTASLLLTAALVPGIQFLPSANVLVVAASAAFLLGIINFLIRPLILLLALPFGFIAIFIVAFFLNAIALVLTSQLVAGFSVSDWGAAFLGSIVLAFFNTLFTSIIAVDNDDSFYQAIAERLAQRDEFYTKTNTQGIVMLEIDGLSYHHIKRAIATGWMPTLKRLQEEEGYVRSRFDCGLPSQTSACQAGILFGENFDIPAFRWYDKRAGKLIVSSHDAPLINARYARGHGLLREGTSVNNMMNGDARVSLLTLADLLTGSAEQQQRRAQDVYLVMLNPYFFLRTLILFFADALREVVEGIVQRVRREAPRMDRLAHFYPLVRAATTVLMRDMAASLAILDIVRGTPALYTTWPGYDEVAHHSGPWTKDAFRTLRQYDKVIRRIHDTIERKAPRPYELVILSDHGQSYGWTFKQRYGKSLHEMINELTPHETGVVQSSGGDDGIVSVSAMAMELDNLQQRNMGGRIGRRVISNAQRAAQRGMRESERANALHIDASQVVVCGSGNLAQVYFTASPERLTLDALNALYPGLVDTLVQHEGIGIVMAYDAHGAPIAFGKSGARHLDSGDIVGQDPLTPYGDAHLRAQQLQRLAAFPNNGDLTIISTLYPDGTVAAMEELVGNHGGIGGEQTDAFLFHPPTFEIPPTSNSAEVFAILNARRDIVPPPKPQTKPKRQIESWAPDVLGRGLLRTRKWLTVAFRALLLDRWAYRQAAFDPYMTSPALLLVATTTLLASLHTRGAFDVADWAGRMFSWLLGVLFAFGAARLLRGSGDWTMTMRGMGFAHITKLLELLALIEPLGLIARVAAFFVHFLATWLAVSEAHKLRGWRTIALPFLALGIAALSALTLAILFRGAEMSVQNVLRALDILPR
jgi:uncharacterized membrane protein YvlD (DUF360 family)